MVEGLLLQGSGGCGLGLGEGGLGSLLVLEGHPIRRNMLVKLGSPNTNYPYSGRGMATEVSWSLSRTGGRE